MTSNETLYLAAGCFWGVQSYFDQVPGVVATEVGYIGGHTQRPSYDDVITHTTGHAEAVKVDFDPTQVTAETVIRQFFRMHDPTQLNRQGPDVGDNYRSAIFYTEPKQQAIAQAVVDELNQTRYDGGIVTTIESAPAWWPAEDYHQKYTEKTGRGACHVNYAAL